MRSADQVFYDGIDVGQFFADILVEKQVIVENKAVEQLNPAHEVQLVITSQPRPTT
jgi:GxxExxY protein